MAPCAANMKNVILATMLTLATGAAYAQTTGSNALSTTQSDAGAFASTGSINFEASEQRATQRVHTTPSVYVAPSMFGPSNNNCGNADTLAVSVTGFGFGGSKADESIQCNTRQDIATAWNAGLHDVARMRFTCFGEDLNRMAFEATGGVCPSSATATGIEGAPVGPKFLVAASVQLTLRQRINADGTISRS